MLVPLRDAVPTTCGGKAGALGVLLRAGLPVPDGFVVPFAVHRAAGRDGVLARPVVRALERALGALGDPHVAVRSSAAGEDARTASAAGQYDSVLAARGAAAVADAIGVCWASLSSSRAMAYRSRVGDGTVTDEPAMAVIVQRLVDADVSGVMFTPGVRDGVTAIEASWGLGPSVAAGTVTPDVYRVGADGAVTCVVGDKRTRLDRVGERLVARAVAAEDRRSRTLDDATARALAACGEAVAAALGAARDVDGQDVEGQDVEGQDVEWVLAGGRIRLVQARPVTTAPPPAPPSSSGSTALTGIPGSRGTATGPARTVRGPDDFARVRPGDILVCPFTDPAWTPLLRTAAGVVTEVGGALSHAAIVAREQGIPAVLGIPGATTAIADGATVTVDGTAGTVST